jgi:AraC family transcriptional regulator
LFGVRPDTRTFYAELVERAASEVALSLDEALDLPALAKRAGLSPLHFHRIFRGLVGETPLELHRRLRLERAAFGLLESDAAVTRLAFEAGYETHESFTRAFREAYDAAPSEFRARTRAKRLPWAAETASMLPAASGIHWVRGNVVLVPLEKARNPMHVTIADYPPKRVLAVSHRGPYNTISDAFTRLDGIVRGARILEHDGLELVALYHDDAESVPAADLRADAGLVVPPHVPVPSGLHEVTIPAGKYARALHEGPYQLLGDAWARFMGGWLVQSGHRIGAGPMYERYLNTPGNAAPDALRTELYLSLAEDEREPRD